MEVTDSRASIAPAGEGQETAKVVDLPPGLTVLTPEQVAAQETKADDPTSQPEEMSVEEQEKLLAELRAKAEQDEKEISEMLAPLGTYMLIRFENPASVRHTVSVPNDDRLKPDTRAIVAVFEEEVRKIKVFEAEALLERQRKMKEDAKGLSMQALGLNREERRLVDKLVRANVVRYV